MSEFKVCDLCDGTNGLVKRCRRCNGSSYHRKQPKYLKWVRSLPCLGCGRFGVSEAHHEWLQLGDRGIGTKVPDNQAVPLCHDCHFTRTNSNRANYWRSMEDQLEQLIAFLNQIWILDLMPEGCEWVELREPLATALNTRWIMPIDVEPA